MCCAGGWWCWGRPLSCPTVVLLSSGSSVCEVNVCILPKYCVIFCLLWGEGRRRAGGVAVRVYELGNGEVELRIEALWTATHLYDQLAFGSLSRKGGKHFASTGLGVVFFFNFV